MRKPCFVISVFVPLLIVAMLSSSAPLPMLAAEPASEFGPSAGPRILYENYDGLWYPPLLPAMPDKQALIAFDESPLVSSPSEHDTTESSDVVWPAPKEGTILGPRIVCEEFDAFGPTSVNSDPPDFIPVSWQVKLWDLPSTGRTDGRWIVAPNLPRSMQLWHRAPGWLGASQPVSTLFSEISRDEPESAFEIKNAE